MQAYVVVLSTNASPVLLCAWELAQHATQFLHMLLAGTEPAALDFFDDLAVLLWPLFHVPF